MTYKLDIQALSCCELCGYEIYAHEFDCPICKKNATDYSGELDYEDPEITCEKCDTTFIPLNKNMFCIYDEDCEWEIKEVGVAKL